MTKIDDPVDTSLRAANLTVTLLGTGSVLPETTRFGPATLVQAGDQSLLFDFGRGATIRLAQLGLHPSKIDANFVTHFHSDHTVGLPDVWLTATVQSIDGSGVGRKGPMTLIGPRGTAKLAEGLKIAYAADIAIRCACDGTPKEAAEFNVQEFARDEVVYQANGVSVTAFEVDHHELIKPAYGFRVEYKGRSAVISGDTRYCENLVQFSRGTDILVHEVMMAHEQAIKAPGSRVPQVLNHHIVPEVAGRVFSQVAPKLAVYTHLVLPGGGGAPAPTLIELEAATRTTYTGPLAIGADLDRYIARDSGVSLQHFDMVAGRYAAEVKV